MGCAERLELQTIHFKSRKPFGIGCNPINGSVRADANHIRLAQFYFRQGPTGVS